MRDGARTATHLEDPRVVGKRDLGEIVLAHRPLLLIRRAKLQDLGDPLDNLRIRLGDGRVYVRHDAQSSSAIWVAARFAPSVSTGR